MGLRDSLKVIIKKIGIKEETRQGLRELYHFKIDHPEAGMELEQLLSETTEFFRGYVARGLEKIAAEEPKAEGMINSSIQTGNQKHERFIWNKNQNKKEQVAQAGSDAQDYRQRLEKIRQMYDSVQIGSSEPEPVYQTKAAPPPQEQKTTQVCPFSLGLLIQNTKK